MRLFPPATRDGETSAKRAHLTFWTLGATAMAPSRNGHRNRDMPPTQVPVQERLRRLPEAIFLTAGYYVEKAPILGDLVRRPH